MDDGYISDADYSRCLSDLAEVNRLTMTHQPTLRWLAQVMSRWPAGMPFSVLDVAYGYGELLRQIHRLAERYKLRVSLQGIDLNPRSAVLARQATPPAMAIDYCTGDVFAFQPATAPDFIVSSQFSHHLSDWQVVGFLQWLEHNARRGWLIADLQRNPLAYYSFPLLARLMRWHDIVRHDGTVSIARSFRRRDWHWLLAQAGLQADIRWHVPGRWTVGRLK